MMAVAVPVVGVAVAVPVVGAFGHGDRHGAFVFVFFRGGGGGGGGGGRWRDDDAWGTVGSRRWQTPLLLLEMLRVVLVGRIPERSRADDGLLRRVLALVLCCGFFDLPVAVGNGRGFRRRCAVLGVVPRRRRGLARGLDHVRDVPRVGNVVCFCFVRRKVAFRPIG